MKSFKKISLLTTLFAFILSVSFSTSYAQVKQTKEKEISTFELKGEVVDANSGTVLADAQIAIAGKDIKTISGKEGKFQLKSLPAGEHTLKVKLEGYQTWEKKITLEEDAELTIKLKPNPKK